MFIKIPSLRVAWHHHNARYLKIKKTRSSEWRVKPVRAEAIHLSKMDVSHVVVFTSHCKMETGIYTANSKSYVSKVRQTEQDEGSGAGSTHYSVSARCDPTGFIVL